MKNHRLDKVLPLFVFWATLSLSGSAIANGDGGVFFSSDAELWGTQPSGHYRFIFDNREYSPLEFPSPEERTIFGQDLRLGLSSKYDDLIKLHLGFRLWNSFGESPAHAVTLNPDINILLYWDNFTFLGGQYRTEELHPSIFFMNNDAPDLPGIKLHVGRDDLGGSLFLARPHVPGNLQYETYAGGGQFWWGNQDWDFNSDNPLKDSMRLQWSGVHQAGFDTGGQHFQVPPGARKRESYAAILMGSLSPMGWLRLAPMAGGTLTREDGSKGFMAGLETDAGFEFGPFYLVTELSGWYLGKNLHSYWAQDDFSIYSDPEVITSAYDPWSHQRYMPGAAVKLYFPIEYFRLELTIDERLRFLDKLGGPKDWDRNRVVIQMDLDL